MYTTRTVSAAGLGRRGTSVLPLAHVDGQTRLDVPETHERRLLRHQGVDVHVYRRRQEDKHHSASCGRRGFATNQKLLDGKVALPPQSHLPFMVLKRRMPSAGPQIWIRSSLLILKRSAPARRPEGQLCPHGGVFNICWEDW